MTRWPSGCLELFLLCAGFRLVPYVVSVWATGCHSCCYGFYQARFVSPQGGTTVKGGWDGYSEDSGNFLTSRCLSTRCSKQASPRWEPG